MSPRRKLCMILGLALIGWGIIILLTGIGFVAGFNQIY